MPRPIAILVSDLHLSHNPPAARSAEPDWYAAMGRYFDQLKELKSFHGNVPIICAGDVFDKWKSPPELINWAIENLPTLIAIPGQHDLPNHRMEDIEKSAYWTLVKAGVITHLAEKKLFYQRDMNSSSGHFYAHPFHWGEDIKPMEDSKCKGFVNLAVVHKYVWIANHSYPGADESQNVNKLRKQLEGYDASVFGDNHRGFMWACKGHNLINCGTFLKRKIDEKDYTPQVGILREDGSIQSHHLDTSQDRWCDVHELCVPRFDKDFDGFLGELKSLETDSLDFREAVNRKLEQVSASTELRKAVLDCLE